VLGSPGGGLDGVAVTPAPATTASVLERGGDLGRGDPVLGHRAPGSSGLGLGPLQRVGP
jgi:hypothetical protein